MARKAINPGGKTGRRTKEDELKEFAAAANVDPQLVADFLGAALKAPPELLRGEPPEKFSDWLPRIRELLWEKVHEFDGIAAVNAYKLIKELATAEKAEAPPEADDTRRPVLDQIEALPAEHAVALIKQELARMDSYRDDLFAALAKLEAA